MQTLSSPAAEALRQAVRGALTPVFDHFLTRLPATLVQTAPGPAQPRSAADELAYSVTADRLRWRTLFVRQVDGHLIGDVSAPVAVDGALETADSMAMASIELRGEALHQALIRQLDARLDTIRRSVYVPVYARALAPAGLCRALQDTALAMGCSELQRRLLFAQFDVLVIGELRPFYRAVIDAVSALRAHPAATSSGGGVPAVPRVPTPAPQASSPSPPPVPPPSVDARPRLDPRTASMLQGFAATAAGQGGYHDGSLAADLLALDNDTPVAGIAPERSWVPLQRIELAGQFLNEAISDPLVSEDLRPQHEAVRFPLVKSALTDATLFTAVTHPLRSLVNDLMLKSATSRVTGSVEARQMADVLRQVLVQFDLAPDFVREAMLDAQPIEPRQIQHFLEMQRQQARQRREAVIAEAKRQVVRKLELATFGRMLPAQAIEFLNTVWGPLLVKRLLQYGADQPPCTSALSLMDQMLDQLDGLEPGQPPSPVWLSLMRAMGAELIVTGLAAARVDKAIAALQSAWKRPDPAFQADGP